MDQLPPMPGTQESKATGLKGLVEPQGVVGDHRPVRVGVIATAASPFLAPEAAAPSAPTTEASVPTEAPAAAAPEPTEASEPRKPPSLSTPSASRTPSSPRRTTLSFSAFSKTGLIDQLSSKYGDGFPKADAVFAVNHISENWKRTGSQVREGLPELQFVQLSGAYRPVGVQVRRWIHPLAGCIRSQPDRGLRMVPPMGAVARPFDSCRGHPCLSCPDDAGHAGVT